MADSNEIDIKVIAKDLASNVLKEVKEQIGGLGTSAEKSSKGTNMFTSTLGNMASVAGGIISAQIISRLTGGVAEFATKAIDGAKNAEQLEISFTTMLKSGDKARQLMKDITDAAAATPFELPELQNASKQLLAFGVASDDIIPTLKRLGDVASGIGAPVGDLAYLFGTIKTQGKAATQDINQFASRGIPIWEELAKVTGQSGTNLRDLVEKGKIGFPEINQAFINLTENGGKFAGLMEAQSKSLEGIQSNISDTVNQLLVSFVQDTGIFDHIKEGASNMLTFLTEHGPEIKAFFLGIINGLKEFAKSFTLPIAPVNQLVKVFADFISKIRPPFEKFINTVIKTMGELLPPIIARIQPLLDALGSTFSKVFTVVGDILAKVFEVASPLFEFLAKMFGIILPPIIDFITRLIADFGDTFQIIWNIIQPVVSLIIDILKTVFYLIQWLWDNVAKPALQALAAFWRQNIAPEVEKLKPVFQSVADFIQNNFINPALQGIIQVQQALAALRQDQDTVRNKEAELKKLQDQRTTSSALSNGKDQAAKNFLKNDSLSVSIYGSGGIDSMSGDKLYNAAASRGFKFAQGGDFITNGPMPIIVGDNPSGRERVTVTPLGNSGGGNKNVNITNNFINTQVDASQLTSQLNFRLNLGT